MYVWEQMQVSSSRAWSTSPQIGDRTSGRARSTSSSGTWTESELASTSGDFRRKRASAASAALQGEIRLAWIRRQLIGLRPKEQIRRECDRRCYDRFQPRCLRPTNVDDSKRTRYIFLYISYFIFLNTNWLLMAINKLITLAVNGISYYNYL